MALWSSGKLQRRVWDRRARRWDQHRGLERVIDAVLAAAEARPGLVAVDLGCGTGQLTLGLARCASRVTAVDVSGEMVDRLRVKAAAAGLDNITYLIRPIECLELPEASVDLVVSNYSLHHLRDRDKEALVGSAARWLRPGGKLVVGDMMFGRGISARDRAIIGSKVVVLVRRGPPGWWRLVKNLVRFSFRLQERPVTMETWRGYFEQSGFTEVSVGPVMAEAGVAVGTKPSLGPSPFSHCLLLQRSAGTGV